MEIRDMRTKIGLSQKAFSDLYHIPLQTLKQWESRPTSKSYRKPPAYVVYMLERLVQQDFGIRLRPLSRAENLIVAAEHSRGSAKQWLRYLRKELEEDKVRLTEEQISEVLSSSKLDMFQRIVFKRFIETGTATNAYIIGLNRRAKTPMFDKLLGGNSND